MKVALVDDESPMRDNLKALLHKYVSDVVVIGEASGVKSGLEMIKSLRPDVLFLDVEMKDGTGFDLLSQHGEADFRVIFVTGHDRYAIKAFKYSAVDYLLKPVDPEELKGAIEKVKVDERIAPQKSLQTLIENYTAPAQDRKILLKDSEAVYLIRVSEIVRCESSNNYTIFHLAEGKKLMITRTLKEYEKLLDDQNFFRTHQSHLINLNFFSRYDKRDGGSIVMNSGDIVPLSTRKRDQFLVVLENLQ